MTLLGSPFSTAFAEVVLVVDAIIVVIVLLVAFSDRIAAVGAKVLQHAAALAHLIAHLGPRHR